jgi:DNA-binding XRE family transcriptional regulator
VETETVTVANPTTLYRFYDAADRLLYVGISDRPQMRTAEHRRRAPWWDQAVRSTLERFASRADAAQAETSAICSESPVFNLLGKPVAGQDRSTAKCFLSPAVVRQLRTERGMTMEALAHAAGLTLSTVARIEKGHIKEPSRGTVRALATALGVPAEDLEREVGA